VTAPTTRAALAAPATHRTPSLALPRTHCNTAMPSGSWAPKPAPVRAGADDHSRIKSLGLLTSQPKERA